jgi:hypothetical protein
MEQRRVSANRPIIEQVRGRNRILGTKQGQVAFDGSDPDPLAAQPGQRAYDLHPGVSGKRKGRRLSDSDHFCDARTRRVSRANLVRQLL